MAEIYLTLLWAWPSTTLPYINLSNLTLILEVWPSTTLPYISTMPASSRRTGLAEFISTQSSASRLLITHQSLMTPSKKGIASSQSWCIPTSFPPQWQMALSNSWTWRGQSWVTSIAEKTMMFVLVCVVQSQGILINQSRRQWLRILLLSRGQRWFMWRGVIQKGCRLSKA